ncbi:MAG TPA: OmpA family protein [Vicinamibacterales bacterium]|nr:OmpA family protein [Vicinamibacterales bacterium]
MPRHASKVLSLFIAAALVTLVVACGKKQPPAQPPPAPPPVVTQQQPPAPPPQPTPPPPVPPPPAPTEEEIFARMTLGELNAKRPLEDVLFEYDKADLSDKTRASLQKNATWLAKWTSTKINIEGHADSRGTNEYNLALGERRAAAIRDYLVTLGVPATRINILSKGEEQPLCTEEIEGCWAQNRRGHFDITAK